MITAIAAGSIALRQQGRNDETHPNRAKPIEGSANKHMPGGQSRPIRQRQYGLWGVLAMTELKALCLTALLAFGALVGCGVFLIILAIGVRYE
jgi:hypothetical protein